MRLYDDLEARGFIEKATSEEIPKLLTGGPITCYIGFDPTAPSFHAGNLIPILGLARFQRAGHRPLAIVGGATGMIGDPSGKSKERNLLGQGTLEKNMTSLRAQLERFLDFGPGGALLLNNADWLGRFGYIEFLRDVGKSFRLGEMLAKETVRSRVSSEAGISYTEFSYMLLQAYDFLHLHDTYGCVLQAGGSDQWGNITSGIELIRKTRGKPAYGIVFPLLLDSTGQKLGKTSDGERVWLDPELTSAYRFYQYWFNAGDADAVRFLKLFTFLPIEEIASIEKESASAPEKRASQRRLAEEVTRLVHGEEALRGAVKASEAMFGGSVAGIDARTLDDIFADVPSAELPRDRLAGGLSIVDFLVESGLSAGKGAARRLIDGGGVYLNNVRVESAERSVTADDLVAGSAIVLRQGKKNYRIVRFKV